MNNILIVEDEHLIARLIEMTLTRAGYRCTLAEDGRTAADLIETTNFDMALLDILSLFTDAPVQFDEKVFTREVVAEGEIKVVKNSDTVDLNPGRLLPRSPALRKALNAIQTM